MTLSAEESEQEADHEDNEVRKLKHHFNEVNVLIKDLQNNISCKKPPSSESIDQLQLQINEIKAMTVKQLWTRMTKKSTSEVSI